MPHVRALLRTDPAAPELRRSGIWAAGAAIIFFWLLVAGEAVLLTFNSEFRDHLWAYVLNTKAWQVAIAGDPSHEELDQALRDAREAVEKTKRQVPAFLDTLGWIHYRRLEFDPAEQAIEEAQGLAPKCGLYAEHLRKIREARKRSKHN